MKKRLITWIITLSASSFVLPFATCATSAIDGVVQSIQPCDIINCDNPQYIDPCVIIQCERTTRPVTLDIGGTDTTTTTTTP